MGEHVTADSAVAAREIVKGFAVVSSGQRRRQRLRLRAPLGSAASLEDVQMDNATADFAVAARAIVKGLAVVPSGSALQQGSHRSRTRRSMCDILAFATILSMQRRQQCLD